MKKQLLSTVRGTGKVTENANTQLIVLKIHYISCCLDVGTGQKREQVMLHQIVQALSTKVNVLTLKDTYC